MAQDILRELSKTRLVIKEVVDNAKDLNKGYFVFIDRDLFLKLKDLL